MFGKAGGGGGLSEGVWVLSCQRGELSNLLASLFALCPTKGLPHS